MATVADILNSPVPQGSGKLKALWDAVRSADPAARPQPTSSLLTATIQAPTPGPGLTPGYQPPYQVPERDPNVPPPVAMPPAVDRPAQMSRVLDDTQPLVDVNQAAPDVNKMPASARVGQLQTQLDTANGPTSLKQRIFGSLLPLGIGLGTAAIARGQSGAMLGGINKGEEIQREQGNLNRANLTAQLQTAEGEREKEYDVAQRTVEQANAAREAALSRQSVARILGGSREAVADTSAGARLGAVGMQGQTARDVAAANVAGKKSVAEIAADARIKAGKYAADAANGRLTRTLNAAAGRQQAGFAHTDTKPTADEDRRADLAKSFSDIADEVKEIATRRPDLFGPGAGRWASLKNLVGTGDPDIASLHADKEALGQIMLGAHSMRNASHIATAANSVLNSFNNEPEAIIAGLESARANANTMNTITRPTLTGKMGGSAGTSKSGSPASPSSSSTSDADMIYVMGKGLVPNPKKGKR